MRIDVSSANFRANSNFQVRTSQRNPIFRCLFVRCLPLGPPEPPAIESSIAVEDAVENRRLYRVFVRACFKWVNQVIDTTEPLSRN